VPDLGGQVGVTVLDALLKAASRGVLEAVTKIFSLDLLQDFSREPRKTGSGLTSFRGP